MIVMRLRGRLGNQLFIYAFGRALQEQYQQPLILLDNVNDTGGTVLSKLNIPKQVKIVPYQLGYQYDYYHMKASDYGNIKKNLMVGAKREYALRQFCIKRTIPVLDIKQACQYIAYKLITRRNPRRECFEWESLNARRLSGIGLFLCENGYIQFPKTDAKDIFAFGYFQSERYFSNIKDKIKVEVQPKKKIKSELQDFITDIQKSNSVCLSIRMGDYLNNPVMGVCTPSYYQKAIDQIYCMYQDARIFVFSDDVEGVRKNFHFQNEVVFEPTGNSEWEKLKYMSMCKHFIISNSSFSWWTQYMGEYPNKTVIAPQKWFAKDIPCDIWQSNWCLLPV